MTATIRSNGSFRSCSEIFVFSCSERFEEFANDYWLAVINDYMKSSYFSQCAEKKIEWILIYMHSENAGPSYYFFKCAFLVSKIRIKRKFYYTLFYINFFCKHLYFLRRKRTVEKNYFTCIVLGIHSVLSQCVSTSFIENIKLSFLAFYSFRHIIVKFINNSVRCDLCEFMPRRKYSFRGSVYSNTSDAMHLYSLTRGIMRKFLHYLRI